MVLLSDGSNSGDFVAVVRFDDFADFVVESG